MGEANPQRNPQRRVFDLSWRITDSHYREIVSAMANLSSQFALAMPDGRGRRGSQEPAARQLLEEFLLDSTTTRQGSDTAPARPATVDHYRSNNASMQVLLGLASSFWDWCSPMPADLQFMRPDGSVVVGTTVCECYSWICGTPSEISTLRDALPDGHLIGTFDPIDDMNRWLEAYRGDLEWSGAVNVIDAGASSDGSQTVCVRQGETSHSIRVGHDATVTITTAGPTADDVATRHASTGREMDALFTAFFEQS